MDTLLREATSSPALENVSSWKHRIRLRPFMFLQSRSTDGQVPRAPCPMAWLLAQLPSASSFQHLLTIQATEVAFHSAVSFRSFKRSPDWKHGSAFQSEKKKKSFFFLEVIRWMGIAFPEGKCKTMHLGKRWQPHRKDAKPVFVVTEERGGSKEGAS